MGTARPTATAATAAATTATASDRPSSLEERMTEIAYTAWIMGEDDLIEVDIRTLPDDRLEALRAEAFAAGDTDLVEAITGLGRI